MMHALAFPWRGNRVAVKNLEPDVLGQIPALPPPACVTSGKSLNLYLSLFIYKTGVRMVPGSMEIKSESSEDSVWHIQSTISVFTWFFLADRPYGGCTVSCMAPHLPPIGFFVSVLSWNTG